MWLSTIYTKACKHSLAMLCYIFDHDIVWLNQKEPCGGGRRQHQQREGWHRSKLSHSCWIVCQNIEGVLYWWITGLLQDWVDINLRATIYKMFVIWINSNAKVKSPLIYRILQKLEIDHLAPNKLFVDFKNYDTNCYKTE